MPTFAAVLDTPTTPSGPSTADLKPLQERIALLETLIKKCGKLVVRDHKPTDAETDGSWDWWKSEVVTPDSQVHINFFRYIAPTYSRADWADADEVVLPWEATAIYDPVKKTYTQTIAGVAVEYSKESPKFQVPNADSRFSNMAWKMFSSDGTEIGNGGSLTVYNPSNPNFLNIMIPNPAMAQGRSPARIEFVFTPITGNPITYVINL